MTEQNPKAAEYRASLVDGLRRYAQADRTDPFAFVRGMEHIRNGLARTDKPYDADMTREMRKISVGDRDIEAEVVVWQNVRRP